MIFSIKKEKMKNDIFKFETKREIKGKVKSVISLGMKLILEGSKTSYVHLRTTYLTFYLKYVKVYLYFNKVKNINILNLYIKTKS